MVILPKISTSALKGIISPRRGVAVSIEEMNEAAEAGAAGEDRMQERA